MYDAPSGLSPELRRRMEADRASGWVNPWAAPADGAIRREDVPRDVATIWRPCYVRDIEKIMNTPAYARYTGKTQVFSFRLNDDISRRGLHVQLVSRVARDIGSALGLNTDLIEAIALGHDIGHTPFGHTGERILNTLLHHDTGRFFMHNVHSVRVIDKLYGRNVSLQTLDGILCHNGEYERREFRTSGLNCFDEFDSVTESCYQLGEHYGRTLVPMTLEGCVVRLSDIIAYVGKDRQDAVQAGLLAPDARFDTGDVGSYNAWVLTTMIEDVIEQSYGRDRIAMSERAFEELAAAKRENYQQIYQVESVAGACVSAISPMFERLYQQVLEDLRRGDEEAPVFRHHINQVARYASHYGHTYDWESDLYQTTVDYLAAMTDGYLVAYYEWAFPQEKGKNPLRGYFSD